MSEYSALKATINANIKTNNNHEITGAITNSVINAVIDSLGAGYQYMGLAVPATSLGTPDQKVFWMANQVGEYANGLSVVDGDGLVVFYYDSTWHKMIPGIATTDQMRVATADIIQKKFYAVNPGGFININGGVTSYAGASYSDYIPVKAGQQFKCYIGIDNSLYICFYNNEKVAQTSLSTQVGYGGTLIIPNGDVSFMRFCSRVGNSYPGKYVELISDTKSLQDINEPYLSPVWQLYSNNSADNIEETFISSVIPKRLIYNIVKDIKLWGFDSTKKHTLYVLWNASETHALNFRISDQNPETGIWSEVFAYAHTYDQSYREIYFDETISGKRVVAFLDLFLPSIGGIAGNDIYESSAIFNELSSNPEYIFKKSCYQETQQEYTAGDGILINNHVISTDPDSISFPDIIKTGEPGYYDVANSQFSISGFAQKSNGTIASHSTYTCTDFLPCVPGQQYLTSTQQYSSAAICFYDADKAYINQYYQHDDSGVAVFTIPVGAAFMRISCAGGISNKYAKLQNYDYLGLVTLTTKVKELDEFDKPFNVPVKLYPQTKLPVISFQFDDIPQKDSEVVDLFESYHLTCAFAFIASQSNILSEGQRYIDYQKKGFQIMSHSVDGAIFDTTNYTYQTAMATIMNAKNRIQAAGMICNGFVAPSSSMDESFIPILKMAHAYAFTTATTDPTANGRNQDTCQLHRYTMESHTLEETESFIDSCIENDQIITLYGHAGGLVDDGDSSVWSLAKIEALIQYCIAKRDLGQLFIGGTDECVKYYFDL